MGGVGGDRPSGSRKLAKAQTFAARPSANLEKVQPLTRQSLTRNSATEPTLPPERLQAERGVKVATDYRCP